MQKKKWIRPELTILLRGKPEELILGNCKAGGFSGDADANLACDASGCGTCNSIGGS